MSAADYAALASVFLALGLIGTGVNLYVLHRRMERLERLVWAMGVLTVRARAEQKLRPWKGNPITHYRKQS